MKNMSDKKQMVYILGALVWVALLVVILFVAGVFGPKDSKQAPTGNGENTQQKENSVANSRLPTQEDKEAVKKKKQELFNESKKEMEKTLKESGGLTKDMNLFQIQLVKHYLGADEIKEKLNSPKVEVDVKDVEIKEDKSGRQYEAVVKFRVENFIFTGENEDEGEGKVKVYTMDKQGNKKFVFWAGEGEAPDIVAYYTFVYRELGSDVYLTFNWPTKESLEEFFKDVVKVGVQTTTDEGMRSLQDDHTTFDVGININLKK